MVLIINNHNKYEIINHILDTMKTRAKAPAKASAEEAESKPAAAKVQLGPESSNPPQLFILPDNISQEARIVTFKNPRYLTETRYLVCPERGFYEFTKVGAPKTTPRSWLLSPQEITRTVEDDKCTAGSDAKGKTEDISKGYVTKSANMFIATQVDPLFLVLPALAPKPTSKGSEPEKKLYLSGEDYIDRIGAKSNQLKTILRIEAVRALLESRMGAICDTVDAGDETMFRMNETKLLKEMMLKAQRMSRNGLPESMEEKFVRKALEVPMLSIKRDEGFMHELIKGEEDAALAESGISTPTTESDNSQASVLTAASSSTEISTAAASFSSDTTIVASKLELVKPIIDAPDGIADLLRLRTAFSFICSSYLQPHLTATLKGLLSSPDTSPTDFSPLDTHLAHLAKLRQDAVAARSLNDMSRKRTLEDDEEDESRAEKKRKRDEEEKRKKAGESRGVKNLKKVNTVGMKKMSDFFKKKA